MEKPRGEIISTLSEYANQLPAASRRRYVIKIKEINFTDPYVARLNDTDFPTTVTAGHVVQFLLNHSEGGAHHLKNTRSIEAYKKFEAGMVHSVTGGIINDLHVVRGKVSHSMRLNSKPLTAWMIIQKDGSVRSAHCTCVAGLSETCSHVSTILYALANLHFMTSTYKSAAPPVRMTPTTTVRTGMLP
nr:uncharacterized protein LOC115264512 [Aedes albopictus]